MVDLEPKIQQSENEFEGTPYKQDKGKIKERLRYLMWLKVHPSETTFARKILVVSSNFQNQKKRTIETIAHCLKQ